MNYLSIEPLSKRPSVKKYPGPPDTRSANYSFAFMLWKINQQKDGLGTQKYGRSSSCRFNGLRYQQEG
jgi:hypothetical protein